MIEKTIICDYCSAIIAAHRLLTEARKDAAHVGARRIVGPLGNHEDVCASCVPRIEATR